MKFFKDYVNEISKDMLTNYYIEENHSWRECLAHFSISNSIFSRLLKYYEIKKDTQKHNELIAKTKKEKYGSATYNNRNKAKKTCLEKYGVENLFQDTKRLKDSYIEAFGADHPMHNDEIKEKVVQKHNYEASLAKARQTYFEATGYDNPGKNPESIKKGIQTKIENGVFNSPGTSNIERRLEKILCRKFKTVMHHYRDSRYARPSSGYMFECDFYIPELDLFIELNAAYYHGDCPFDSKNNKHILLAEQLKNSLKKWEQAKYECWCVRDIEKQTVAKNNNLNYLQLYPTNSIFNNQQFNNKKYSEIISYLLKKLNNKK